MNDEFGAGLGIYLCSYYCLLYFVLFYFCIFYFISLQAADCFSHFAIIVLRITSGGIPLNDCLIECSLNPWCEVRF